MALSIALIVLVAANRARGSAPIPVHLHRPTFPLRHRLKAATQSSQQASITLDALCELLPQPPKYLLSDNGSESMGHFQQRLEHDNITHWWTYPISPQMNAHAERFNRTIQEQFVDYHQDELFHDLAGFNRKLANWLLDDNTVLPHHSLGLRSPVNYLIHNQPECQRWWTYTQFAILSVMV